MSTPPIYRDVRVVGILPFDPARGGFGLTLEFAPGERVRVFLPHQEVAAVAQALMAYTSEWLGRLSAAQSEPSPDSKDGIAAPKPVTITLNALPPLEIPDPTRFLSRDGQDA